MLRSGRGLIKGLSLNLFGRNEENLENPQDSRCPGLDSNRVHLNANLGRYRNAISIYSYVMD
jgi:hypothetical protein